MASIYDLYVEQGSDFTESIDMTGDYTGYTIRGSISDNSGVVTTGIVAWTDATLGQFDISLTNVETSALKSGVGKYDIEIESATNVVSRILKGRVYVDSEVTV